MSDWQELKQAQTGERNSLPPAQNENYGDFIVSYNYRMDGEPEMDSSINFQVISDNFAVLYLPLSLVPKLELTGDTYNSVPKLYTYMDLEAIDASGISRIQNQPYLNLKGQGTLIAVIDSGIDYRNPIFRRGDRTRILRIWDQSLVGEPQEGPGFQIPYGREFREEDINRALTAENPLEVVPSTDTNGHGTMVAGIAAGKLMEEEGFSGAAPEASLLVVKLKPAKEYLREFFLLPSQAEAYQENDIMLAVAYAISRAQELKMPLSICIGLGSSMGSHTGEGHLETFLAGAARLLNISISVAGGNEGNSRHHYDGKLSQENRREAVELRVGEDEPGFTMEFWGSSFHTYRLSLQSPTGEILPVSTARGTGVQRLSFVFVDTKIEASYVPMETQTGQVLVFFRFLAPAAGIWKLLVEGVDSSPVNFYLWLPVQGFLSPETYFLSPSPYQTITNPGNARNVMTVTAYDYRNQSLYLQASRGFAVSGQVKPDLAAPGVEVLAPALNGGFVSVSGTSVAAAQTAGAAALFFEWGIVKENAPLLNGTIVKNYLLRGAVGSVGTDYPNRDWGYGRMDLYHSFELIS